MKRCDRDKAISWSCIPRNIMSPVKDAIKQTQWIETNQKLVEYFVNSGQIDHCFN